MARQKNSKKARQAKAASPKPQINVRMEHELFDLICSDAEDGERKPPAQVRLILKEYYKDRLPKKEA